MIEGSTASRFTSPALTFASKMNHTTISTFNAMLAPETLSKLFGQPINDVSQQPRITEFGRFVTLWKYGILGQMPPELAHGVTTPRGVIEGWEPAQWL